MRGGGIHRCRTGTEGDAGLAAIPGETTRPMPPRGRDRARARRRPERGAGARPWAYPVACTAISEQLFLAKTVALLGSTSGRVDPSSRVAGLGQQLISTVMAWVQRHSWCHLHLDAF